MDFEIWILWICLEFRASYFNFMIGLGFRYSNFEFEPWFVSDFGFGICVGLNLVHFDLKTSNFTGCQRLSPIGIDRHMSPNALSLTGILLP